MFKGVFPPIATPFVNDEVAYDKLAENLARWNQTGLSGYVALGSNGESVYLTRAEKLKLIEAARKYIPADKALIAGSGSDSIRETVSLTNEAAERGANAALILTPSFYKGQMKHNAFLTYFRAVADQSRIPLLIYQVPKFTGVQYHRVKKQFGGFGLFRRGDSPDPGRFSDLRGNRLGALRGIVLRRGGGHPGAGERRSRGVRAHSGTF